MAYGAFNLWQSYSATHQSDVKIPVEVVRYSTDEPAETMPTEACRDYQVAAELPRRIIIESIGVDACVQQVGRDQDNAVAVPTNIHLGGWFIESAKPGDVGNSIIDGHVNGRYADAVFVDLGNLKSGDTITVELGDYSRKAFSVIETKSYPVEQAAGELFRQLNSVDRQLTLITCGGSYNNNAETYDERVIVRAASM